MNEVMLYRATPHIRSHYAQNLHQIYATNEQKTPQKFQDHRSKTSSKKIPHHSVRRKLKTVCMHHHQLTLNPFLSHQSFASINLLL